LIGLSSHHQVLDLKVNKIKCKWTNSKWWCISSRWWWDKDSNKWAKIQIKWWARWVKILIKWWAIWAKTKIKWWVKWARVKIRIKCQWIHKAWWTNSKWCNNSRCKDKYHKENGQLALWWFSNLKRFSRTLIKIIQMMSQILKCKRLSKRVSNLQMSALKSGT